MSKNVSKMAAIAGVFAVLASTLSIPAAVLANNWWAGQERSGSCWIPNMQTSFQCQFGSYRKGNARQIGGFYVNPTNQVGHTGTIPLEYRVNGGQWIRRNITMNATSGNYIDFGNGVSSFDFRFPRPDRSPLRVGGAKIYFKFNYDLDR